MIGLTDEEYYKGKLAGFNGVKEYLYENRNSIYTIDAPPTKPSVSIDADMLSLSGKSIKETIKDILKQYERKPTFKHTCNSCGGTLEMDIDNHLFICPYCNSVYAIGTQMVNSR